MTPKLTQDQKEVIVSMYDDYSCVDIAKIVGVTLSQVYDLRKRLGITKKQNPIFELTDLQHQILLGGKLGDGNFKPNGNHNYYYRESHAEDELGYLIWKMDQLGNMINNQGLYKIKKAGYNVQQLYGFPTVTSPSLIYYAESSLEAIIPQLDYRGLIIFMLDDGTFSTHSKAGKFVISGGILDEQQIDLLCNQYEQNGIYGIHRVGKKKYELTIPSSNNIKLLEMATSFIPIETDIIQKKFGHIIKTSQI